MSTMVMKRSKQANRVSLQAQAVARTVISKVQKGEKVNYGEIIASHGYAPAIAKHPQKVLGTKSYRDIAIPALAMMENIRGKMLQAIDKRDLTKEKMPVLLTGVDVLTKNARLLGGQSTENVSLSVLLSKADDIEDVA